MTSEPHPALDELVDDIDDDDEIDGDDVDDDDVGGGPATPRRWVRYVMPVMVEVDYKSDVVTRVVTLPEEIREDRDDMGHFLVYDEKFVRRTDDLQPETHAWNVAQPRWQYDHLRAGPPVNWPMPLEWEEGFDLTEADDAYTEIHPYDDPK